MAEAVQLFGSKNGHHMVASDVHLIGERKPCQPHFCQGLPEFVTEYRRQLGEDHSLASTSIGIAYLKLLGYLRTNSGHIARKEVLKLLQKYDKTRTSDGNVLITLLDVIAGKFRLVKWF